MKSWIDTAAVLLFAGMTAMVAIYARGWLGAETEPAPAIRVEESYAARVSAALPSLERKVATGSMRTREMACTDRDELADIAELEAAIGAGDDPALSAPLAEGIAALRECVACTPEPTGCGAAARAFTIVEKRLGLAGAGTGI